MSEIKIGRMVMGVCQTNCYFLYRQGERLAVVVDPADRGRDIYDSLRRNGFSVAGILLTHGHFDHIWGLDGLRDAAGAAAEAEGLEPVKAYACKAERELLKNAGMNVSRQAGRACETYADVYVEDGEEITLAGMTCRVIATPGHTGGGCSIISRRPEFWCPGTLCLQVPWAGRISPPEAWALWSGPSRRSSLCCRRIQGFIPATGRVPPSETRRKITPSAVKVQEDAGFGGQKQQGPSCDG